MIKAAFHVHSDWSYDGNWPLTKLAAAFGQRGYQVVMMTEHDRGFTETRRLEHRAACAAASNQDILLVPGIEYSDAENIVHILVWGPVPFLGEAVPTAGLLQEVHRAGGVAVLAHPSRKEAWRRFQSSWAERLVGLEVWNRKTDGWAPSSHAWSLVQQTNCQPFVGLDFHSPRQFFPLAALLDVQGQRTESAVIDCLRERRCASRAFGRPLVSDLNGWSNSMLASLERYRRRAAATVRAVKARVRA